MKQRFVGKETACWLFASLALAMASTPLVAQALPEPSELTERDRLWVETTLEELSLEERAAQMIMVRVPAGVHHPNSNEHRHLLAQITDSKVGGVVAFRGERDNLAWVLNELQEAADLPLLVAADFERGASFRLREGAVSVPYAMAIGATRDAAAAEFVGELTAREARAMGIHWTFAPVVDVNNNPSNPVINLRSFGEDPELVGNLAAAFIAGARRGGVLTSAKHFPGHGDTGVDSHLDLPLIPHDRDHLERFELLPFRRAIEAGVDSVMLGHLSVPALDPSGDPATLSSAMASELLRDELGFTGLTVTDGLEMKGLDGFGFTETIRRTVAAGSDLLLLPRDAKVAIETIARSVEEGVLDRQVIDGAARRVLETKVRLGLHRERTVDPAHARQVMGSPDDIERALSIAGDAVTLLRNRDETLPLRAEESMRVLHLSLGTYSFEGRAVTDRELRRRAVETSSYLLPSQLTPERIDQLEADATAFTHILVSAYSRVAKQGDPSLDPTHAELLRRLSASSRPLVVVAYRNPYLLGEIPEIPVYLTPYGNTQSNHLAVVRSLFGEHPITGKLPVSIPGVASYGEGLELQVRDLGLPISPPQAMGLPADAFAAVDALLEDYQTRGAFPGGVLAIGYRGKLVHLKSFGRLTYAESSPAVVKTTQYDLASLTKVIVTTSLSMMMVDEDRLDLDAPIATYLPRFEGEGKGSITVRHLLTHSSGIDWWAPLHLELAGQQAYIERIQEMDLVYDTGTQMKYSDLGILLLGEILQRISGSTLDELAQKRLFDPLGMTSTGYRPEAVDWPLIAPTEDDPWRGRILQGEVHDENAFALGGVAPHAGLFGTAPDLARFAQLLLNRGVFEHRRLIHPNTVELFTQDAELPPGSRRALGWDTKSPRGSSAGQYFDPSSYGHTGFTGTSLWIDPSRDLFVVLLTNRVHPTRQNRLIREVRPAVADAVVLAVEPTAKPAHHAVLVGLDRIAAGDHRGLAERKIGLVAHAASVALDGRHAIEVFGEQQLDVVRLLSPEHGLSGRAGAGESVDDSIHSPSGLPIVSLYGTKTKPTPQDLAGLDALVFDLQGAGVRFYTYASTLIGCLEAAAEAGIDFYVLDRPNPLGGLRVEGPVSAPRSLVPQSFVNRAPGPLVHGLTLGEMAQLVNDLLETPATLTVVPMKDWRRDMEWNATGRTWVSPSPNLRSPEAALAYPGVALLEATNVNEGRGTEQPFLRFGAPWLSTTSIVSSGSTGFSLQPVEFVPVGSSASRNPKYQGEECLGFDLSLDSPGTASPYRLGVELLSQLSQQEDFRWLRNGEALTWLLGSPDLLGSLRKGESVKEILALDQEDHAVWLEKRNPYLLYE